MGGTSEEKIFDTSNDTPYRYYKFEFEAQDGQKVLCITSIKMLREYSNVSHKNASLVYTLPMATTEKIKAKSNDSRVGLLGMVNDDENFGDLYVVGKDGKSHLAKTCIKSDVLFEGEINSVSTVQLTNNIVEQYKYILIYLKDTADSIECDLLQLVPVKLNRTFMVTGFSTRYVQFMFDTNSTLKLQKRNGLSIIKVIGIY